MVKGWLGRDAVSFQDFATAFHNADQQRPESPTALHSIATSANEPPLVRAAAVERLGALGAPLSQLTSFLGESDPVLRRSGLRAVEQVPAAGPAASVVPLLSDPIRSVRIAAGRLLAPSAAHLGGADLDAFKRATADIQAAARFNADRPEARLWFGVFLADQGRTSEAENEYRAAIRLGPDFPPGYINLAELVRMTSTEAAAEEVLRSGITRNPRSGDLHYALGLSLTRSNRATEANAALKLASELAPENARFSYAYALALNKTGESSLAIRVLTSTLARHPHNRDLLFALAAFERDAGRLSTAREYAKRLVESHPADPEARAFQESLRGAPLLTPR
jgi:Flp pilus assembly protein TadD